MYAAGGGYLLKRREFWAGDDPREEVELAIDAYAGSADRFVDENEHFEMAIDEVGSGTIVQASWTESSVEDFSDDGIVANGFAIDLSEATDTITSTLVYKSEDEVDLEMHESTLEDMEDEGRIDSYDIAQSGQVVIAEYDADAEEFW